MAKHNGRGISESVTKMTMKLFTLLWYIEKCISGKLKCVRTENTWTKCMSHQVLLWPLPGRRLWVATLPRQHSTSRIHLLTSVHVENIQSSFLKALQIECTAKGRHRLCIAPLLWVEAGEATHSAEITTVINICVFAKFHHVDTLAQQREPVSQRHEGRIL